MDERLTQMEDMLVDEDKVMKLMRVGCEEGNGGSRRAGWILRGYAK